MGHTQQSPPREHKFECDEMPRPPAAAMTPPMALLLATGAARAWRGFLLAPCCPCGRSGKRKRDCYASPYGTPIRLPPLCALVLDNSAQEQECARTMRDARAHAGNGSRSKEKTTFEVMLHRPVTTCPCPELAPMANCGGLHNRAGHFSGGGQSVALPLRRGSLETAAQPTRLTTRGRRKQKQNRSRIVGAFWSPSLAFRRCNHQAHGKRAVCRALGDKPDALGVSHIGGPHYVRRAQFRSSGPSETRPWERPAVAENWCCRLGG